MQILYTLIISVLISSGAYASGTFPLEASSSVLMGSPRTHVIKKGETLIDLARTYGVGHNEIVAANRDTDPWVPTEGKRITIPTQWLLPEMQDNGILINLAEMRLYYFFKIDDRKYVKTFPLGIGIQGKDTPTGNFKITTKVKDPVWKVPDGLKQERPELPDFVQPGPDNPLGGYWLQLSIKGYGIHGTNRPYGIGRNVSQGCIRLYPEDIEILFQYAKPGTKVKIINEPLKAGIANNRIYIEVHNPDDMDLAEILSAATKMLSGKNLLRNVDSTLLIKAIKNASGLPAVISK